MSTPLNLLDDENQGMVWQKVAQKRRDRWQNVQQQDTIVPDAAGLDAAGLYGRIGTIRSDSASATQGAVAAAETKRQYEQALQAAKMQKQQQQALMDAYNAMNSIASGAGFGQPGFAGGGLAGGSGGSWGGGGAQGVANLMRAVGFPDSAIQTGIAITKAESGWNPNATHSNANGSLDAGLWQINSIHRGNSWYPTNTMDPLQSTRAAYAIWKGAGGKWTDWSVYNSGKYRDYLSLGQGVYPNAGVLQPYVANTGSAGGLRNAIVSQAMTYIGVPYVWGRQSRSGTDCSGLVYAVYNDLKMKIPRLTAQGFTMESFTRGGGLAGITGVRTSVSNLRPGDLVGWNGDSVGRAGVLVGHIAIYAGNGEIVEASGARVRRRRLGNENIFGVALRFPGE